MKTERDSTVRLLPLYTRILYMTLVVLLSASPAAAQESTPEANVANQPTIGGNALHLLPQGGTSEVELIGLGEPTDNQIAVIVRNNTDSTVYNPSVKIDIRDAGGSLVGVAETLSNHAMKPTILGPGHVAIGFISISEIPGESLQGADITYTVKYEDEEPAFSSQQNVEFGELNFTGTTIVGEIVNPSDEEIGWIYVMATCVSTDGQPLSSSVTTIMEDIAPNSSTTFQMTGIFGDITQCENFLIAGYG